MNSPKYSLDIGYIRSLLDYDPETGNLTWRTRRPEDFKNATAAKIWNKRFSGRLAGTTDYAGYIRVRIGGHTYRAHRLIHALCYNKWPEGEIDHINHIRSDNRLVNLRQVDRTQNSQNIGSMPQNKSGCLGVHWHARDKKWQACIRVNGRPIHIGSFDLKEDASNARRVAEKKYGFHPNHGSDQ